MLETQHLPRSNCYQNGIAGCSISLAQRKDLLKPIGPFEKRSSTTGLRHTPFEASTTWPKDRETVDRTTLKATRSASTGTTNDEKSWKRMRRMVVTDDHDDQSIGSSRSSVVYRTAVVRQSRMALSDGARLPSTYDGRTAPCYIGERRRRATAIVETSDRVSIEMEGSIRSK